jgi:LL-diaminopimelate aminotransferase
MKTANRLAGVGEYYFSQKLREIEELNRQGKNIINLGIGSPDLPPHPTVIRTLQEEAASPGAHSYQPYKAVPALRKAFSDWYQNWYDVMLNPDSEILPLMGSKEGILHICMTFFEEGMAVLVPDPGYPTYESAVKLSGATPVFYELKEENYYEPDFEELENMLKANAGIPHQYIRGMFVNYPHMPTGRLPSKELFEKLVAFAKTHQLLIIHDNPYSFILNDVPMSLLCVEGAKDCVLELNSLSKTYNMAGWRVGALCGAKEKIDAVMRFKSNMDSGMFLPVQRAAVTALSLPPDWHHKLNNIYRLRQKKVFALLDVLQCTYTTMQAGLFVWAKIPAKYRSGFELSDELLYKKNVFITPGGIFGKAGNNHIRVSLCLPEEKLEEAKQRILNQ